MIGNADEIVILSACPVSEKMKPYLPESALVIACDAGYRNAQLLGIKPDIIVGDFDSAPQPESNWAEDLVLLPHVKDDTDTQYAASLALEHHPKRVTILGGLGGKRMEHTLANLSTGLWLAKRGVEAILADEYSRLQYLLPGRSVTLDREDWKYFSVFPMEGQVEGLTITGAFYPLENARLTADYPLGVSNEFVQPQVTMSCTSGIALVVLTNAE